VIGTNKNELHHRTLHEGELVPDTSFVPLRSIVLLAVSGLQSCKSSYLNESECHGLNVTVTW